MLDDLKKKVERLEKVGAKIEKDVISLHVETQAQTKILTEICRTVKSDQRDLLKFKVHAENRLTKVENDVGWIRKAGMFIATALGVSHVFK